MKATRLLAAAMPLLCLLLDGCDPVEERHPSLRVNVSSGATPDEALITLSLDAEEKDGYTLYYSFFAYDLPTGRKTLLPDQTMRPDGETAGHDDNGLTPLRKEENVSFLEGRKAYHASGLAVGTYALIVQLEKGSFTVSGTAVFVVTPDGIRQDNINDGEPVGGGEEDSPGDQDDPVEDEGQTGPKVTDFSLPEVDGETGRLRVEHGSAEEYRISYSPSDATPQFEAASSDEEVATITMTRDGLMTVTPVTPGFASVAVTCGDLTKTLPILVHKDVRIRIAFEEDEATEAQIKNKTFPCRLVFMTEEETPSFDSPVVFTVSAKAVVTRSGHDAQEVTDKTNLSFRGNKRAFYDVEQKLLIPAWQAAGRQSEFGLSISLSLQKEHTLNPQLWTVSFDEVYLSQECRIRQYITGGIH